MKKLDELWTKLELYCVGILSLSAALIGLYGVLMRYVFVQPIGWAEEVITYLMVWALLIIISPVQKDNEHIRLDIVYNKYPKYIKPYIELLILLISIMFTITVVIYGWDIVKGLKMLEQTSQSSLQIPLWIVRLSIPFGFTLLTLRIIQSGFNTVKKIRTRLIHVKHSEEGN